MYWQLLLLHAKYIWNSGQDEILSNPKFIVDKLWFLC